MTDHYGLGRQDKNGTYLEGPLKGHTSVNVLIGERETKYLQHAMEDTGYSFERLVQISAEEAAIDYARRNNIK